MKRLKNVLFILGALLCVGYYLVFGSPLVDWRNAKLVEATNSITSETITLEELVPFAWDAVYVFEPYESETTIAETIGFSSVEIHESRNDSDNWYYFVKGKRIVSNPETSSLGYVIVLPHHSEINIADCVRYGEQIVFEVKEGHNGILYLQPVEDEAVVEDVMVDQEPGITLEATDITSTGLVLKCTHSGNTSSGELQTGSWYEIEQWTKEYGWRDVAYAREGEIAWTMEAWMIPLGGTMEWNVRWESLYGTLTPGKYRIGKEITNFNGSGDYTTTIYYAEFEIE